MSLPVDVDALNREVSVWVGRGYTVESVNGSQAVLVRRARIGLFWNVLLSVVTGGLWLIVVLYKVLNRKTDRVVLYVDETGRVRRR